LWQRGARLGEEHPLAAVIRLASAGIPASILTLVVLWQLYSQRRSSSRRLFNLVLCCFCARPHRGVADIP